MPLLSLEVTGNLRGFLAEKSFLDVAHQLITNTINAKLSDCKSRVLWHDTYHVGDGSETNAFVFLQLDIMPGRTDDMKKSLGEALVKTLKEQLATASNDYNIQFSVHIRELDGKHYYKL